MDNKDNFITSFIYTHTNVAVISKSNGYKLDVKMEGEKYTKIWVEPSWKA
jgi:hypothetical protein